MLSFIQRRMPSTQAFVLLCVVLSSLAVFGQNASLPPASRPAVHIVPGSPAPDFSLQSVNGETVRLFDFQGQTVLIYFWATWVGPCKVMTPWLADLQSKYASRGFHVIAVALDDDATRVEIGEFADQNHMSYPVLLGNDQVAESYGGVPAMPESILVGQDGKIVERIVGLRSRSELEKSIKKALSTKSDPGTPAASQAQN